MRDKKFRFISKAQTLSYLSPLLKKVTVLPFYFFTVSDWEEKNELIVKEILKKFGNKCDLIVRSSSLGEDNLQQSLAGKYLSEVVESSEKNIYHAVNRVIDSYEVENFNDEVLVQPYLKNVDCSGVVFSCDPNAQAPYIVINYDNISGKTNIVTSGVNNEIQTYYFNRNLNISQAKKFQDVIELVLELEIILESKYLDIEFAKDKSGNLYLFQVRPLILKTKGEMVFENELKELLLNVELKTNSLTKRHPFLFGNKSVFGVMPDWNPAEIIGLRPSPLSMSLYKEIVTDTIWAFQRNNYGYKNLRSFPLMIDLGGIPFIDVRVSFNSFLPDDLSDELSEKLVNYYISKLIQSPDDHDKVEFKIIYSCYTLDLESRLNELMNHGFTREECKQLENSLKNLTKKIVNQNGPWKSDLKKIELLEKRRQKILDSDLEINDKIYWLIEDCKRYGSLPFAGLARAGFIAIQLLDSLVSREVITVEEKQSFLANLESISGKIICDFEKQDFSDFLKKYGHLRPGTYDPLSLRYDEAPEIYFNQFEKLQKKMSDVPKFGLSLAQLNKAKILLEESDLELEVVELLNFIKDAIEAREYSKFIFTKNLSDAINLFIHLGKNCDYSRKDCSFAEIGIIYKSQSTCKPIKELLTRSIQEGKHSHSLTQFLILPYLITCPEEVWQFDVPPSGPNFVTLKRVQGKVLPLREGQKDLNGAVIFIPNADPGYDWIFAKGIAGLVTKFGGSNSHMAIRASELGIPAVIGSGETLYEKWAAAKIIQIDCSNKQVQIIQ